MTTYKGQLTFHSETGTEGGWYAFQDGQHVTVDEFGKPQWSYKGLMYLKDGDYIKVLSGAGHRGPDDQWVEHLFWQGSIKFHLLEVYTDKTAHVDGLWVNQEQEGFTLDEQYLTYTPGGSKSIKPVHTTDGRLFHSYEEYVHDEQAQEENRRTRELFGFSNTDDFPPEEDFSLINGRLAWYSFFRSERAILKRVED